MHKPEEQGIVGEKAAIVAEAQAKASLLKELFDGVLAHTDTVQDLGHQLSEAMSGQTVDPARVRSLIEDGEKRLAGLRSRLITAQMASRR